MKIVFNNAEISGSVEEILLECNIEQSLNELFNNNITVPDDTVILSDNVFSLGVQGNQGLPINIIFEGDPPILEGDPFNRMDVTIYCDLTNPKWIAAQTEWGRNPGGAFTVRWYQKS